MGRFHWLAAYPKSGSTWLRFFVSHLMAGERAESESLLDVALRVPVDFGQAGFDRALGIKLADLTSNEALNLKPARFEATARHHREPVLYRTHDAWTSTPFGEALIPAKVTAGAVHLVRDPRDIAVSYAEFFACSQDEAIFRMAEPQHTFVFDPQGEAGPQVPITLLDWSSHCRSWLNASGFPRLLLRYEDLLANPVSEFTKLAQFIKHPASPELIHQAIEATRFDRLKKRDTSESFAYRGDGRTFFRSGRSGGWRQALSKEQVQRVQNDHGAVMALLGYPLV